MPADSNGRKRAEGILPICFGEHHQRVHGEHHFVVNAGPWRGLRGG
jgi:hypothetical protein